MSFLLLSANAFIGYTYVLLMLHWHEATYHFQDNRYFNTIIHLSLLKEMFFHEWTIVILVALTISTFLGFLWKSGPPRRSLTLLVVWLGSLVVLIAAYTMSTVRLLSVAMDLVEFLPSEKKASALRKRALEVLKIYSIPAAIEILSYPVNVLLRFSKDRFLAICVFYLIPVTPAALCAVEVGLKIRRQLKA